MRKVVLRMNEQFKYEIIKKLVEFDDIIMCITSSSFKNDFIIKSNIVNNEILNSYFNIDKNVYMAGDVGNKKLKPDPNVFLYAYKDVLLKNNLKDSDNILVMGVSPLESIISGILSLTNLL